MSPTVQQTHWGERCLPVILQLPGCPSSQVYNDGSFPIGKYICLHGPPLWPRPRGSPSRSCPPGRPALLPVMTAKIYIRKYPRTL